MSTKLSRPAKTQPAALSEQQLDKTAGGIVVSETMIESFSQTASTDRALNFSAGAKTQAVR